MSEVAELKSQARAVWAAGDYDAIAELIWPVGERIVRRLEIAPGEEVLDVACGTGNAAIPAARDGGRVVGLDLTGELFGAAEARAEQAGVEVEWAEGDAEELPFADQSFDVVVSTFGAMFAPRHEVAAGEITRVLRPGGRLGLCSWTPEGNVGEFFRLMAAHVPPPADAAPPTLWGTEDHVRQLFPELEVEFERELIELRFESVAEAVSVYETKFGPVVTARERLEPEGRWKEMREDLAALFRSHNAALDGGLCFEGEYLVALGRRPAA